MVTKERGFDVGYINWSCPSDLRPYAKAHEQETKEQDLLNYIAFGQYYRSALTEMVSAVTGGFLKSVNMAKFAEEPFLSKEPEITDRPLTEEEITEQTRRFFQKRQIDKIIFDSRKRR